MQLKIFLGIVGISSIALALPVQVKPSLHARQGGGFDAPGNRGVHSGGGGSLPPNPDPNTVGPPNPNDGLPDGIGRPSRRPTGFGDPLTDGEKPVTTRFGHGNVPPNNTEDFPTTTLGNTGGNNEPITDGPVTESPPDSPPPSADAGETAAETAAEETGASAGPELGTDVGTVIGDALPEILSG